MQNDLCSLPLTIVSRLHLLKPQNSMTSCGAEGGVAEYICRSELGAGQLYCV